MKQENAYPKRVLVMGLTDRMGGIETYLHNFVQQADSGRLVFEFLVIGTEKPVYYDELVERFGSEVFHYVREVRASGVGALADVARLFWRLQHRFDYVYVNTVTAARLLYCVPYAQLAGAKIVIHSHNGSGDSSVFHRLFRPLVPLVADSMLSCSDKASDWMFGRAARSGKITHVPNGVDTDRFSFDQGQRKRIRDRLDIPEGSVLIGNVGRLSRQKNQRHLLHCLQEYVRSGREDRFLLVVGEGELETKLKAEAKALGVDAFVRWAGGVPDPECYYSAMDVYVMPSLYEGLPISAVEAVSSGLKCVFSDAISSDADILRDGLFVPLDAPVRSWVHVIDASVVAVGCRNQRGSGVLAAGYGADSAYRIVSAILETD